MAVTANNATYPPPAHRSAAQLTLGIDRSNHGPGKLAPEEKIQEPFRNSRAAAREYPAAFRAT